MDTEQPTIEPQRPAERAVATQDLMPSEKVLGRTVLAANGTVIGSAERLLIDPRSWRIESLEVRVNRDIAQPLGLKKGFIHPPTIRIATTAVRSIGDAIILGISVDDLRREISDASASVH